MTAVIVLVATRAANTVLTINFPGSGVPYLNPFLGKETSVELKLIHVYIFLPSYFKSSCVGVMNQNPGPKSWSLNSFTRESKTPRD